MPFDGPQILDQAERNINLDAPVFRIWNGATLERVCRFDAAKNEPRLTSYGWPVAEETPTMMGNTGNLYPQPQGVRLEGAVEFVIRHPMYSPPSVAVPPSDGFTENDWKELSDAAMYPATYDIEFYPHDPPSGTKLTRHVVEVTMPPPTRGNNMTEIRCVITVRGRYVQTATPTEM